MCSGEEKLLEWDMLMLKIGGQITWADSNT